MMTRREKSVILALGVLILALVLVGCQQRDADSPRPSETTADPTSTPPAPRPETVAPATSAPVAGPTPAAIAPADEAMVIGDPEAAVTIVEFSDYECPFCARYGLETWPLVKAQFVDTGRVQYTFKDYPLAGLHPQAARAHIAARCAGDQGAYWEMHSLLFEEQSQWSRSSDRNAVFETFAADLGLETGTFSACLASGKWDAAVRADVDEGARLGVRGTPTFFVNGYPLVGAQPFELLEEIVRLAEEGTLGEAYQPTE